jgi:hypothetical protein
MMECMEKTFKYHAVRAGEMYPPIDPDLFCFVLFSLFVSRQKLRIKLHGTLVQAKILTNILISLKEFNKKLYDAENDEEDSDVCGGYSWCGGGADTSYTEN